MNRFFKSLFIAAALFAGITAIPIHAGASCLAPENCPCDIIAGGAFLVRGTVASVDETTMTVAAVEIFKSDPNVFIDLNAGEIFGGTIEGTLPCGGTPETFSVGDDLLAFYFRGTLDAYPDCEEYKRCTRNECGAPETGDTDWDTCDGQCVTDTREACALQRDEALVNGRISAVSWAEEMTLRESADGSMAVSAQDIEDLTTPDTCRNRFPDPPAEPCNDVVNVVSCSAGGPFQADFPSILGFFALLQW